MEAAGTLREARHRAGLTQRALALRAGVPQPTVARIETGFSVPRVDTLDRLLSVCGFVLSSRPRPGQGVDRSAIHSMLALSPAERLRVAASEARNLDRLLAAAAVR